MDIGIPEVLLIIAGLVAFLIVVQYRKDKDSKTYNASMVLGVIVGAALIIVTVALHTAWSFYDSVLIIVAGFALLIRPFRNTDIAIVIAVLAMAVVYVWLGHMSGDFSVLSETWPRIILAVIAGAIVYMILNFIQKLTQFVGKILNFWPILFLLGLVCLVEGALIIVGGKTLFDYVQDSTSAKVILSLFI